MSKTCGQGLARSDSSCAAVSAWGSRTRFRPSHRAHTVVSTSVIPSRHAHALLESDLDIASVEAMEHILRTSKNVAVLGAKPDSRIEAAAHWIPKLLQELGYNVIPVPVRYPDVTHVLGVPVFRRLQDVPPPIDVLSVFRKPEEVPAHLDAILEARPSVVWFQSGLIDLPTAKRIAHAGIIAAHDCIACRRATIEPTAAPLHGQR